MSQSLSRRSFLTLAGAGALIGAVSVSAGIEARPAAAMTAKTWAGNRSSNGWPIGGRSAPFNIEGTDHFVTLATGNVSAVLLHAVRRFNYEIDTLRDGDVTGLISDRRVVSDQRSNLLSGTAVLIRGDAYAFGVAGSFYPSERTVLDDILAEAGGTLAWGGHLDVPDEGLLYVAQPPAAGDIAGWAEEIAESDRMSAAGGAGQIDAFAPDRIEAADMFLKEQGH